MTDVEKFSRGEPISVEVEGIERALADLWKEASRAQDPTAGERAVSRAALWNIIVPTHGRALLERTKQMVDEMAPSLPARAILLHEEPGASGDGIRATIESNVVSRPGGTRVVYSEEITLAGDPGAESHFGALVRALQIPGLPTATLWVDATMPETLLERELLPLTDRLVLDTGSCEQPVHLVDLQRFAAKARAVGGIADLGWLRLASFRLLFAGLFDSPVGGDPLHRARHVTVRHRPGAEISALMLGAWLGAMLEWRPVACGRTAAGGRTFHLERALAGGRVELVLDASPGECGTSGIVALELVAESAPDALYAVHRTPQNHAELTLPIAPKKVVKLDSRTDAELCVAALGPSGRDPLLPRCLTYAAKLASLATAP